jgi:tRNA1Val (adenine37-N6)-methyltransferase
MANQYFQFKQFLINQGKAAFKVGTDGVLLGAWADVDGANQILDIGTGTGLIALMLAQRSKATITAIEPDHDSFEQASGNVEISLWSERIRVLNKDLVTFTTESKHKFDLIVSNPPYFINSLQNPDPLKSATRHTTSLTMIDILNASNSILAENGKLVLILPYVEGTLFIAEASSFNLYCNQIVKIKTYPAGPVKRLLLEFGTKKEILKESFLTIEQGKRHVYTDAYIDLTKDFYLYS